MGKILVAQRSKTYIDGLLVTDGPTAVPIQKLYSDGKGNATCTETFRGQVYKTVVNVSDKRTLNVI